MERASRRLNKKWEVAALGSLRGAVTKNQAEFEMSRILTLSSPFELYPNALLLRERHHVGTLVLHFF